MEDDAHKAMRKALLLKNLHITPPSLLHLSSAAPPASAAETGQDFDFADVFDPNPVVPTPSSSAGTPHLPEIILARSHSLVGPSPRYPHSPSPFTPSAGVAEEESGDEEDEAEGGAEPEPESERKIGPEYFEILRLVGRGAFGKVFLVRKKDDVGLGEGEVFAMKVMKKEVIIRKNQVEYMQAERDILTKITHPFIVRLRYSFQTKSKLYLVLDFINGGHLFFQLYRHGLFREDQARLYTAEIVSAVSHLHRNGIVHRDLKPENILMDADGHVMLTDFGLAKEIDESSRSNSMCGTTEYMAPEIILAKGHNKDADWWSVGILLFEMLTGQPPFTHSNRHRLQQMIIKEKVKLPSYLSAEAHSLLKGLLQKEPSKRLGSGTDGGDLIKKHNWFKQIDWKKLDRREVHPKFKPEVNGRTCIANFDKCWTSVPPDDSPAPTPTATGHFLGFSYVAPNPWPSR